MSIPRECPIARPRKRRGTPKRNLEGAVVRDCIALLKDRDDVIYFERRNTGAVQFEDGGFMRFGQKGAADLWCLFKIGLWQVDVNVDDPLDTPLSSHRSVSYLTEHIEIECKRADGRGRLSAAQRKFSEFCESHRIRYILTTSAQGLAAELDKINR